MSVNFLNVHSRVGADGTLHFGLSILSTSPATLLTNRNPLAFSTA